MKNQVSVVFMLSLLFLSLISYGQNLPDKSTTFRIETKDGNIFTGPVTAHDSASLVIKTAKLGEIRIPLDEIKSKTELQDVTIVNNKIWLPNPQSGRYYWAPNGYGLSKGESYYQNIWVLYNQFSYGVAENFSLGAGIIPLFLFAGTATPVWVVPKFSIPVIKDKINIGTGALLGALLSEDNPGFGLLYETTTFGSRDKNVSLGFAYGYASGEWMKRPVINLSTMIRTGPNGYFISENYLIPYVEETLNLHTGTFEKKNRSAFIISFGKRSIIRNVGLDYSVWIPLNVGFDNFVAIPFLGVTIPAGK